MEARVEEKEFRFNAKFTPQAWFTVWSDDLADILSNLAKVRDMLTIVVDGARGRATFYASSFEAFALYSLRAWSVKGFGRVRVYAQPLAEKAKILADKGVDATVTLTREGVLKVAWDYNLAVEYYQAPQRE